MSTFTLASALCALSACSDTVAGTSARNSMEDGDGDGDGDTGTGGSSTDATGGSTGLGAGNGQDGELSGDMWGVNTSSFWQEDETLFCTDCIEALLLAERLSGDQEISATLQAFSPDAAESNLVMLAQGARCELLEAGFWPSTQRVIVTYCLDGEWSIIASAPFEASPGDKLGARIEGQTVTVLINDEPVLTADITDYPYLEGRTGLNGVAGAEANAYTNLVANAL